MKKVLSIVAALLLCVGTQAQIVSSRSAIVKTQKQASNTQWFLRAGLNIMNLNGDGVEADSNIATMLHSAIKSLWAVPEHIGEWNSASVPVGLKPMK